jgi:hypothetical protein
MQVRMVIFPGEDGIDVVISGKGEKATMRHRHFDCHTSMIAMLENLRLLTPEDAQKLEDFVFMDSCPMYSAEIQEEVLAAHGFHSA